LNQSILQVSLDTILYIFSLTGTKKSAQNLLNKLKIVHLVGERGHLAASHHVGANCSYTAQVSHVANMALLFWRAFFYFSANAQHSSPVTLIHQKGHFKG
jgi:hypothetical protein